MSQAAAEHNEHGNAAYQAGNYEEALAHYTEAVRSDSTTAKYYTNLANTLIKLNKLTKALSAAKAAIVADPAWLKGYYFKSVALERQGKLQQALAACNAGLRIDNHNQALKDAKTRIQGKISAENVKEQQQHFRGMFLPELIQKMQSCGLNPDDMITKDEDLIGPEAVKQLKHTFNNAGTLRGKDGSPHPFGWTGGLMPLEKRADWLIDCYRLRATDDAAAAGAVSLHGIYAPNFTPESVCEDFLTFCTLAELNSVAPAGFKQYTYDAWPGWGYLLPLAAQRLLHKFTQADAEAKWGTTDAMPSSDVPRWLHKVATTNPPWGRSLRYTAQLAYGCKVGEAPSPALVLAQGNARGKWKELFADQTMGGKKDQATMSLGGWGLWSDLYVAVRKAWSAEQRAT